MPDRTKIGLFGGTFNPIHLGHLRAAREVAGRLALDRVIFIPSAVPPHKTLDNGVPASDRLAMVKLGIAEDPVLSVSDIEIRRGGESYTLFTLLAFRKEMSDANFTFILGIDAYQEIRTWRRAEEVLGMADWAVIARPGFHLESLAKPLGNLAIGFREENSRLLVRDNPRTRIAFVPILETDLSSSAVRAAAKSGRSLAGMVPDAVAEYIAAKNLYRPK